MSDAPRIEVLVRIADPGGGRQIGRESTSKFAGRMAEVRAAVTAAAQSAAMSLDELPQPAGWQAEEVALTFGLAFAAESSVILTKASGEASLEVSIVYRRAG